MLAVGSWSVAITVGERGSEQRAKPISMSEGYGKFIESPVCMKSPGHVAEGRGIHGGCHTAAQLLSTQ